MLPCVSEQRVSHNLGAPGSSSYQMCNAGRLLKLLTSFVVGIHVSYPTGEIPSVVGEDEPKTAKHK